MSDGVLLQKFCSNQGCQNLTPVPLHLLLTSSKEAKIDLYQPLRKEFNEVRLIRILPGALNDDVCCELFTHRLVQSATSLSPEEASHPSLGSGGEHASASELMWRALSYPWGNLTELMSITVNQHQVQVARNLHEALRWLRYHSLKDAIWIDALCINQSNHLERCEQVQEMGRIYGLATETMVYIPLASSEELDLEAIQQELEAGDISREYTDMAHRIMTWMDRPGHSQVTKLLADCANWKRPGAYWSRLWTLQECILSRSLHVVSGPIHIPWETLVVFLDVIQYIWQESGSSYRSSLYSMVSSGLRSRATLRGRQGKLNLTDMKSQLGLEECSDPRDKLYGVLALLQDVPTEHAQSIPQPDYTLCASCVWRNAAIYEISTTQRLNLLKYAGVRCLYESRGACSWAPDLSLHQAAIQGWFAYHLSPEQDAVVTLPSSHDGALVASGYIFGPVGVQILGLSIYEAHHNIPTRAMARAHFKRIESALSSVVLGADQRQRCIDDMMLLVSELCRILKPTTEELKRLLLGEDPSASFSESLLSEVLVSILLYMDLSWLRISGIASERPLVSFVNETAVDETDLICGLLGCDLPLIVRRGPSGYRIIGQAVVAGYGNGQISAELQAGKRELQSFHFV